ncbi:MAG: FecR domain-containing protein [Leptolyngbyaceae cyanobacterium]
MSQYDLRRGGLASIVYVLLFAIAPQPAIAEAVLTRATVESFRNRVEILLQGGPTRLVQASDQLGLGDAIRTSQAAQIDLRFNEGSLARVGELTTFWFMPNTRNFRLANGTALLLIPPGNGPTTIETPNVVTGIQGTAVVVRHLPKAEETTMFPDLTTEFSRNTGRTAVMVLTDASGPTAVELRDGRSVELSAGQMAIVDDGNLFLFEFDLTLFYETSPLVEGLFLDDPDYPGDRLPTDPVRDEALDGLNQQPDFEGEYLLDPNFLDPTRDITTEDGWLFPVMPSPPLPTETETEINEIPDPEALTSQPHVTSDRAVNLVPTLADGLSTEPPTAPRQETNTRNDELPPGLLNAPTEGDSLSAPSTP